MIVRLQKAYAENKNSLTYSNYMNPGYFTLAATDLIP